MTCIAQLLQNTKKDPKERETRTHRERKRGERREDLCLFVFLSYIFRLRFDPGGLVVLEEFVLDADGDGGDNREDDEEDILFNG